MEIGRKYKRYLGVTLPIRKTIEKLIFTISS